MKRKIFKSLLYTAFVLALVWGQFLSSRNVLIGKVPVIEQRTISGQPFMGLIDKGPAIIYFWAEWCGICRMMQGPVSAVLKDYPGVTVALKSGNNKAVVKYIHQKELNWPVINDSKGLMSQQFAVSGVPTVFLVNDKAEVIFASVGYTSEIGLRLRLWLVDRFF